MKFAYVLAMSATMVLAPVAQAQITCKQANDLMEAATEDFDSLAGEEISDGAYEATFELDGAGGCQVTLDFSASYSCVWAYDSLAKAQADYGLQSNALASCLGDWERAPFTTDSGEPGVKTLEGGSFYSVNDDDSEFTWVAILEEHIGLDTRDWHVWVGLDYF